jgi:hypothetical protein
VKQPIINILSGLAVVAAFAISPATNASAQTGNGAPSGKHYNLNVVGGRATAAAAPAAT